MNMWSFTKGKYDRIRRTAGVGVLGAVIVFAAAGCGAGGPGQASADFKPRPVQTEPVAKHTISSPVEQIAEVSAGTVFDVIPKANGQVVQVLKKNGDAVEEGETLLVIDSKDAESARRKGELSLKSAEESLAQARIDAVNNRKNLVDNVTKAEMAYKTAEQDYNKIRNEFDDGLATSHQVEQLKDALDNARMGLESAQAQLAKFDQTDPIASFETQVETARLNLEDAARSLENYSVKAPGRGILTDFKIVAGQSVSTGAKVGQIQQVDPIKITTELTETNYALVKGKTELVYYNPDAPDNKLTAPITYLAPIMSATSKTYTLEMEIPNAEQTIQPGKRYMVQLTTETEEQVIAVPALSVVRDEGGTFVFVKQGDQYAKRKVKLGRISGEYQEVLEGLQQGEELVISGQNTLKDGQKAEAAATE